MRHRQAERGPVGDANTPRQQWHKRSQLHQRDEHLVSGNGYTADGNTNSANGAASNDLDERILQMEKAVGSVLYLGCGESILQFAAISFF